MVNPPDHTSQAKAKRALITGVTLARTAPTLQNFCSARDTRSTGLSGDQARSTRDTSIRFMKTPMCSILGFVWCTGTSMTPAP